MIKRFIPSSFKIQYQLLKRASRDRNSGFFKKIARTVDKEMNYSHALTVEQPLKQNRGLANKVHNIKLACYAIDGLVIKPGEWFSFWHFIPQPSHKNGFKIGRNLLNGKLQEDYGGGLCQLSGMMYISALRAGLTIEERHNHSIDIYTDDNRYTPLGSDATVVYAYKDFRFKNNLKQNFSFRMEVLDSQLRLHLLSNQDVYSQNIQWNLIENKEYKVVETRNEQDKLVAISRYKN
ncbi:MAG: VanW family protein [Nonlabens sp.]|uniref:VanW family protein n=1 Tax=Nonlabens sp. TaxID=1888209 RepID=UPI003EF9BED4